MQTQPEGPNGRLSSARSISSSPPRPRKTREYAVAPRRTAKINAVVRVVSCRTSLSIGMFSPLFAQASRRAPAAPTPAASVGVANPKNMLPRTARIRKAAGTMALKRFQTAFKSIGSPRVAGA